MKAALRIFALCLALCAGVLLAVLVALGGPNYYGLRPHAVTSGLDERDVTVLTALAAHGPVTGLLAYDAWYKTVMMRQVGFCCPQPKRIIFLSA